MSYLKNLKKEKNAFDFLFQTIGFYSFQAMNFPNEIFTNLPCCTVDTSVCDILMRRSTQKT